MLEQLLAETLYDEGLCRHSDIDTAIEQVTARAAEHLLCPTRTIQSPYLALAHALYSVVETDAAKPEFDQDRANEHMQYAFTLCALGMARERKYEAISRWPGIEVEIDDQLAGIGNLDEHVAPIAAALCEYKGNFKAAAVVMDRIGDAERAQAYRKVAELQEFVDLHLPKN
jgi:hypothetical protein